MAAVLAVLRHNPLLWLLIFVPAVLVGERAWPDAHTLLFLLSVLAIVPLAGLLSEATGWVAAKTGDAVGGLLNATLGTLTELVIAITALRAGEYVLVKASIAGATLTVALVTGSGRSTWFVGVLLLMVYCIFALSLYLMPPLER